jgi:hypothetical protein
MSLSSTEEISTAKIARAADPCRPEGRRYNCRYLIFRRRALLAFVRTDGVRVFFLALL